MSMIAHVLRVPEFRNQPLVLVDIGAAGGVHRRWRRIARQAIGVGFEPDARDTAALAGATARFHRWILGRHLVTPQSPDGPQVLHLTRSPQCSSMLPPRSDRLAGWSFADFFAVEQTVHLPAESLTAALAAHGVGYVDWLKCDTQGLDLAIYRSLPAAWREQMAVVEFEPGLIDAYLGEDKVADVLQAMQTEPFWLADVTLGKAVKGSPEQLAAALGPWAARWTRRLGPAAPAWANLCFVRETGQFGPPATRRTLLAAWIGATLMGQHGHALELAAQGNRQFDDSLFPRLAHASAFRLRASMLCALPGWLWRRLSRSG
jgi:hypothetical protein